MAVSHWYQGQAGTGEDKHSLSLAGTLFLYVWALLKAGGTLRSWKENGLVRAMLGMDLRGPQRLA